MPNVIHKAISGAVRRWEACGLVRGWGRWREVVRVWVWEEGLVRRGGMGMLGGRDGGGRGGFGMRGEGDYRGWGGGGTIVKCRFNCSWIL